MYTYNIYSNILCYNTPLVFVNTINTIEKNKRSDWTDRVTEPLGILLRVFYSFFVLIFKNV